MPKLTDKIKNPTAVLDTGKRTKPLWEGPSGNGPNGGITFSMLSRYLVCKERFRIQYLEGLQVREGFNHRLEFGNMWHICEEANASGKRWIEALIEYGKELGQKYPLQRQEVYHWLAMCEEEFPEYLNYWNKQPEQQQSTTLLQEQVFNVPYKLPSGRTVRLRGKWDKVDLQDGGVYVGDHKTKSQIDSVKIKRQLTFDLQTMLYVIAMQEASSTELAKKGWSNEVYKKGMTDISLPASIKGVKYNVVRRSAHKSPESMLKKIREDVADGRGSEWFARWTVDITQDDIRTFKEKCLDPLLENLYNWWMVQTGELAGTQDYDDYLKCYGHHFTFPHGIYNPLTEGGQSEYDHYLATGSMEGLERTETLFRELQT